MTHPATQLWRLGRLGVALSNDWAAYETTEANLAFRNGFSASATFCARTGRVFDYVGHFDPRVRIARRRFVRIITAHAADASRGKPGFGTGVCGSELRLE